MAAKYIKPSSNLTPKQVWDRLMSGKWSFDDCPAVVIGNLCASVTFTGDGSWQSIARDLFRKGQRNFAVLCGRHGDQSGQEVDPKIGKFIKRDPAKPADTAIDPAADRKIAETLHGDSRLKGIKIVVQDVGNGAHDSVQLPTNEIKSHLSANRIVILAWC